MSEPLNVLQVKDSESDAALIVLLLQRAGYAVHSERVEGPDEMRAALARQTWDVIVADRRMTRLDAAAALRILLQSGQDVPFVVVPLRYQRSVEMRRTNSTDKSQSRFPDQACVTEKVGTRRNRKKDKEVFVRAGSVC